MGRWDDTADEEILAAYVDASRPRALRDDAFHALVDRFERRIYAITYRYFGNHADAEDATQETFLTLARRAGQFRGDARLSTWIYRVTTNTCNDMARKRSRRPQVPVADVGADLDPDPGPSTAEIAEGHELADHVQQALLQLDELSRTLIILCTIEGQGYTEVSAALDLPVGTIKSRVFRARAKLAELLAPALDDTEPARETPSSSPPPSGDGRRAHEPRGPPG